MIMGAKIRPNETSGIYWLDSGIARKPWEASSNSNANDARELRGELSEICYCTPESTCYLKSITQQKTLTVYFY